MKKSSTKLAKMNGPEELMALAKEELSEPSKGDLIVLLDWAEAGCLSEAYIITAQGTPSTVEQIVDDAGDEGQVALKYGGGSVLEWEFLHNRIKELFYDYDKKLLFVNVGTRVVLVDGSSVRPGKCISFVPVDPAEAFAALFGAGREEA
ncbi:MAG: hypothetical protein IJ617_00530 [Oscillospiraceae bacterium]|nr:hypothetical protein [Oscillospiraceae bacterium]